VRARALETQGRPVSVLRGALQQLLPRPQQRPLLQCRSPAVEGQYPFTSKRGTGVDGGGWWRRRVAPHDAWRWKMGGEVKI